MQMGRNKIGNKNVVFVLKWCNWWKLYIVWILWRKEVLR